MLCVAAVILHDLSDSDMHVLPNTCVNVKGNCSCMYDLYSNIFARTFDLRACVSTRNQPIR
jgi:hypothetical protein